MPDEILKWSTPPIDCKSKVEAALVVQAFANSRRLLKWTSPEQTIHASVISGENSGLRSLKCYL
jgi:hypothetical protein